MITNKIFIFAGQSNMRGMGNASEIEFSSAINFIYCNDIHKTELRACSEDWIKLQGQSSRKGHSIFGPEAGFDLQKASNGTIINEKVYIIKFAMGGSSISNEWSHYFDQFITFVKDAIDKVSEPKQLCALCWLQGSKDATALIEATNYRQNIIDFVKNVRLKLYNNDIVYICAENKWQAEYIEVVNNALYESTTELQPSGFITNEGLVQDTSVTGDGKHLDAASLLLLGERFAKKYLEIVSNTVETAEMR